MAKNSFKLEQSLGLRLQSLSSLSTSHPFPIRIWFLNEKILDIADIDKKKEGHLRFCQEHIATYR
ncbi:unnamed protein product [Musa hybrid cultivar]